MQTLSDRYRSYRRQIDVRSLLARYGAENVSESIGSDGHTWIRHSCLLDRVEPHHRNGDANPSAQICVETGGYVCFAYWSGDVIHLIQKLEGCEDLSDVGPIVGRLSSNTQNAALFAKQIEQLFAEPVYSLDLPSYSEALLRPWARSHPYMTQVRGISHETCERLQIGYDNTANRIVFPHWWQGKLVGWQKRLIPSTEHWPGTVPFRDKYKSSPGFPKAETIYRYDTSYHCVTVVESPMSVAKAFDLGFTDVVSTFGASVTKTQIDLLKEFERVYVWFDDDPAGRKGERALVEGLYRHIDVRVVTPDTDRDLGDVSDVAEVFSKLESAVPAALWLGGQRGRGRGTRGRDQAPGPGGESLSDQGKGVIGASSLDEGDKTRGQDDSDRGEEGPTEE